MLKAGNDLNAIKKALEGRGEIKEVRLNIDTGELIINFEGAREWTTLKQDAFRQWEVKYYTEKKKMITELEKLNVDIIVADGWYRHADNDIKAHTELTKKVYELGEKTAKEQGYNFYDGCRIFDGKINAQVDCDYILVEAK